MPVSAQICKKQLCAYCGFRSVGYLEKYAMNVPMPLPKNGFSLIIDIATDQMVNRKASPRKRNMLMILDRKTGTETKIAIRQIRTYNIFLFLETAIKKNTPKRNPIQAPLEKVKIKHTNKKINNKIKACFNCVFNFGFSKSAKIINKKGTKYAAKPFAVLKAALIL